MSTSNNADILIVGAGPAGLTAAIYAIRYGLSVLVFESESVGGQVATTSDVENYPAIERITGFDLAMKLRDQAVSLGAVIKSERVLSFLGHTIETKIGCYTGKSIIIANGAKRRTLNCVGETEFKGKGVSYCATCDGAFFKGKDVAIIGGGNTALEDALFLARHCNMVYLIHRRDSFRAMQPLIEATLSCENITIIYNTTLSAIQGTDRVTSINIHNADGDKEIFLQGVFVAIGTEPDNTIFTGVECDKNGYIIAGEDCRTNIAGIYAAGDTRTKLLRQIVTATADGAVSAFMSAQSVSVDGGSKF